MATNSIHALPEHVLRERIARAGERIGRAQSIAEVCATALMHEPEDAEPAQHAIRGLAALLEEVIDDVNDLADGKLTQEERRVEAAITELRDAQADGGTPGTGPDDTFGRLHAYLASVRPLRGCADLSAREHYQRGRSLIERLALSAHGESEPDLTLTPAQCADVLSFIAACEPIDQSTWWNDPDEGPSHVVGFYQVIEALARSLRDGGAS